MTATYYDVMKWIETGKQLGATHIISVCDTFDWDDYPVYVMPEDDLNRKIAKFDNKDMQKINEVIDLSKEESHDTGN